MQIALIPKNQNVKYEKLCKVYVGMWKWRESQKPQNNYPREASIEAKFARNSFIK